MKVGTFTIPIEQPNRTRIAVNVVAIGLNAVEATLCEKLHVDPSDFKAMRAKRRSGKEPAEWLDDQEGTATRQHLTGFRETR
jgi:hypothetical protein